MNIALETVYQELLNVSEIHTKQNAEKHVHGERVEFYSDGAKLEAVLYRSSPDAVTIVTAFGGGFIMGGCALDDHMWTSLSEKLSVNILSVGYRRTPAYPFPTALYDVYHALCWFCENKEALGIKSDKIAVMGASAGGNLAAGVSILDRVNGTNHIGLQILNYPYLDLATDPADKGHPKEDLNAYRLFPKLYVPEGKRQTPLVSPVYATEELKNLPTAYITVAGNDPLRTEGIRYYENLKKAGVTAELAVAEGMPHGYLEAWFNLTEPGVDLKNGYFPGELLKLYGSGALTRESDKIIQFFKKAIRDVFGV